MSFALIFLLPKLDDGSATKRLVCVMGRSPSGLHAPDICTVRPLPNYLAIRRSAVR